MTLKSSNTSPRPYKIKIIPGLEKYNERQIHVLFANLSFTKVDIISVIQYSEQNNIDLSMHREYIDRYLTQRIIRLNIQKFRLQSSLSQMNWDNNTAYVTEIINIIRQIQESKKYKKKYGITPPWISVSEKI